MKIRISYCFCKIERSGNTGLSLPHGYNWLDLGDGCLLAWAQSLHFPLSLPTLHIVPTALEMSVLFIHGFGQLLFPE